MGNVLAAQQPIAQLTNPPASMDGLSPDIAAKSKKSNDQHTDDQLELENPGTLEEIHKKCKDVMPINFEGGKLMIQKGLSNHFHVSHSINLNSSGTSAYRFGATYIGTNQISLTEAYPVLLGEIDPSGNLNANIINQLTPNIRYKIVSQIHNNEITVAQMSTDYKCTDCTASLTLGNINVLNNSGVLVGHYLQSITRNISLGGELAYQYGHNVPGGEIAIVSASGRYVNGPATWSGTLGMANLHLCYHRRASEQLQIAVEMETNFRSRESVGTIGYQVDLPKPDLVFRGMLDTNWSVGAVLEKKLLPLPFTFALSGLLNHNKNTFKLGVAMIIG